MGTRLAQTGLQAVFHIWFGMVWLVALLSTLTTASFKGHVKED